MKYISYYNINSKFSYYNLSSFLNEFWINNVIISKHNKIWLTIRISTTSNNSYILIKNLPFNTSDYNDVLLVLKEKYEDYLLMNKRYKLKNIYFSYYFDNSISYNRTYIINYIFIFVLLITFMRMLFFIVFFSYFESDLLLDDIININSNSLDYIYANEVCVKPSDIHYVGYNNNTIFKLFIDLFNNKSNSPYKYFPSYFYQKDILFTIEEYSIADSIIEYKNIVNFNYAINWAEYSEKMNNIITSPYSDMSDISTIRPNSPV